MIQFEDEAERQAWVGFMCGALAGNAALSTGGRTFSNAVEVADSALKAMRERRPAIKAAGHAGAAE